MKLYIEHTNDRGTETGFYFASHNEVEAYLSERGLISVPKQDLSRVFRTGYWTGRMQAIAEIADQGEG